MKSLLCLLALVLCISRADAFSLKLDGDLTWNVTGPQCGFRLKGGLQNISDGTTGSLKLVLIAAKSPEGVPRYIVGEYNLGQLPAGYQFNNFTVKTNATFPATNGGFDFTIAALEYTTAGWRTQLIVDGGSRSVLNENFVDQIKWTTPTKDVILPPDSIPAGHIINLTDRATDDFNKFPSNWQERTKLTTGKGGKVTVTNKSRDIKVDYSYFVAKRRFKGKKYSTGNLVVTQTLSGKITYQAKITLYFQRPNSGFYQSKVSGALWNGELNSSKTLGSFKLQ